MRSTGWQVAGVALMVTTALFSSCSSGAGPAEPSDDDGHGAATPEITSGYVPAFTCAVVDPAIVAEAVGARSMQVEQVGSACIYSSDGGRAERVWIEIRTPVTADALDRTLPGGAKLDVDYANARAMVGGGPLEVRLAGQVAGSIVVIDGESHALERDDLEGALQSVLEEALEYLPEVAAVVSATGSGWCERLENEPPQGFPTYTYAAHAAGCDLLIDSGGVVTVAEVQSEGADPSGLTHVATVAGPAAEPSLLDGSAVWIPGDESTGSGQLYVLDEDRLLQLTLARAGASGSELRDMAIALVTAVQTE